MYLGLSDQFKGQWPWPIFYLLFKVKICHIITTTPTGRGPRVTAPCCVKGPSTKSSHYIYTTNWVSWEGIKLHTQEVPPEDLFPLPAFIHCCYFYDSMAFVSGCFLCLLVSILFCLLWIYMWNIQWKWSHYIHELCGWLSCDSSPMCKKYWLCLCTPLHSCWWFGMPLDYGLFLLPNDFLTCTIDCSLCCFTNNALRPLINIAITWFLKVLYLINGLTPIISSPWYSPIMGYLAHLASINTHLPFKSPILKLILADDFVFTDGFLPFLDILFRGVQNVFKKNILTLLGQ